MCLQSILKSVQVLLLNMWNILELSRLTKFFSVCGDRKSCWVVVCQGCISTQANTELFFLCLNLLIVTLTSSLHSYSLSIHTKMYDDMQRCCRSHPKKLGPSKEFDPLQFSHKHLRGGGRTALPIGGAPGVGGGGSNQ